MSGGFDVDAEHRPFELRAEIVRLRALVTDLLDELRENRAEVERLRELLRQITT